MSSTSLGNHVSSLLHFRASVANSDAQSDAAHDHDVRQIVTNVGHLRRVNLGVGEDFLKDGDLLDVTLIDVGELALLGALFRGGRYAPADQSRLDAVPVQPLQADAVLCLGLRMW